MDYLSMDVDNVIERVAQEITSQDIRLAFINLIKEEAESRERGLILKLDKAYDQIALCKRYNDIYTGLFKTLRYKDDYEIGLLPSVNINNMNDVTDSNYLILDLITIKHAQVINQKLNELLGCNDEENEETTGIEWADKTEICELVQALAASRRIHKDGKPLTKKALRVLFEKVFRTDLSHIDKLLNAKAQTAKQSIDKQHFMKELSDLNAAHFANIVSKKPKK